MVGDEAAYPAAHHSAPGQRAYLAIRRDGAGADPLPPIGGAVPHSSEQSPRVHRLRAARAEANNECDHRGSGLGCGRGGGCQAAVHGTPRPPSTARPLYGTKGMHAGGVGAAHWRKASQQERDEESWRWARCDVSLAMEAPSVTLLPEQPLRFGATEPMTLPALHFDDSMRSASTDNRRLQRRPYGGAARVGAQTERAVRAPKSGMHASFGAQGKGRGVRPLTSELPELLPDRRHNTTSYGLEPAYVPTAATFTKQIKLREDVVRLLEQSWTNERLQPE